jgi:hypothetical protein
MVLMLIALRMLYLNNFLEKNGYDIIMADILLYGIVYSNRLYNSSTDEVGLEI